jgi:hypothetical protein
VMVHVLMRVLSCRMRVFKRQNRSMGRKRIHVSEQILRHELTLANKADKATVEYRRRIFIIENQYDS